MIDSRLSLSVCRFERFDSFCFWMYLWENDIEAWRVSIAEGIALFRLILDLILGQTNSFRLPEYVPYFVRKPPLRVQLRFMGNMKRIIMHRKHVYPAVNPILCTRYAKRGIPKSFFVEKFRL